MACSQLKHKYPVFLSPLLENQDFQDFWYHELVKNKNFETFPGHGILIRFAALELIEKFSSNYHQVSYLLMNLEGLLWYFQSKSIQHYEELSKILSSLLQEVRVFFAFPKQQVSNSTKYNPPYEIVGLFIDFLLKILEEILVIQPDFIVSVEGSIEDLRKKLLLLLNFIMDTQLLQPTEVNLLTNIEAVLNEVGSFLYSFFFVRNQVLTPRMDLELSDILRNFELLEAKIYSNMPSRTTRKTAVVSLFIVCSLLDDLTDLLNHKADKIVGVNTQIVTLYEELMLLRSSLTDITLQQHPELEELVIQTTDLAYEIEYVINSFPPVWYLTHRLPQFIDKIKLIMMGIKETNKNIETGIVEVKNYPTEQVSSQEILEDIVVGFDYKETKIAEQLVRGPQVKNYPTEQVSSQEILEDIVVGFYKETEIAEQLVRGPQVKNYPTEQVSSQEILEDVVGFDYKETEIAEHLQIISIFGMPGVGKTTLAKKLYNNPSVVNHFYKRASCVVSQTYKKRNVYIDILRLVNDLDKEMIIQMDDEGLVQTLYKSLIKQRHLIVVDDIWDINAWNDFGRYFPDDKNGSRILFTTRHKEVGLKALHHSVANEP